MVRVQLFGGPLDGAYVKVGATRAGGEFIVPCEIPRPTAIPEQELDDNPILTCCYRISRIAGARADYVGPKG